MGLPSVNDAALEDLCVKEGERRGYDLDVLKPSLTVMLNITAAAYHHLSNVKVKVFIVFYTTFAAYLDDFYLDDPDTLVGVNNFTKHFSALEKHSTKMLDDLANLLAETSQLFGQVPTDFIVHMGLKFILGLVLERQNKDESQMNRADMYALYLCELSRIGEAYTMFIFPAEVLDNTYIQALPIIHNFICFTNDITSFYKEECEGETHNLISFLAEAHGEPKNKALYYLVEKCMEAHEKILLILSPHQEVQGMFKEFVKGFLLFHLGGKRYRLNKLNL
ncbi:isoprenoid synthase domain-containing protein [Armillaria novae-zelandiae]|uniref:Isoprenoid synthase domain-containing protein n=1 Tax=Armillaria novae-zelandiae TaxID=153914 RepID=A0AA39PCI5_9AGAR|nr:isoprenoid synthase domain-containing protein [Armillaria novae-zelandiae]